MMLENLKEWWNANIVSNIYLKLLLRETLHPDAADFVSPQRLINIGIQTLAAGLTVMATAVAAWHTGFLSFYFFSSVAAIAAAATLAGVLTLAWGSLRSRVLGSMSAFGSVAAARRPINAADIALSDDNAEQAAARETARQTQARIVQTVKSDASASDPRRRVTAASALCWEGVDGANAEALAVLAQLARDSEPEVVCAALSAIAEQTARRYDASTLGLLRRCEENSSEAVRIALLDILYLPFGSEDAFTPELLDICVRLSADPSDEVRLGAVKTIACFSDRIGEQMYVRDALIRRLEDRNRRAKYFAFRTLAELGDARVPARIEHELKLLDVRLPTLPHAEASELIREIAGPIHHMPKKRFVPYLKRWAPYANDGDHGDAWLWKLIRRCRWAKWLGWALR